MAVALESMAVLCSPAVLYAVLRLRGMAPVQGPDPYIQTGFVLDPHDLFVRYQALETPTARFREAARVGFLVPARLADLLFGAVPGFYVFRYVLALIAIVPLYLLLKKLYGRWAGFVGIAVIMSSPVVVTAWGTDYPDSAAVSYLTGGLCALALSWEVPEHARGWLAVASTLLTMAVWSHTISVPLVTVLLVVYVGARLRRGRAGLGRDVVLLAAFALLVTGLLAILSALLLGQFDFITPTVNAGRYLYTSAQEKLWHSTNWRWATYDVYLLVPPTIVAAFAVVFGRRWREVGRSQLFVGLTCGLQLATFAFLQFVGNFGALEFHFFSSTLWSSVTVTFAVILAEVARPLLGLMDSEGSRASATEGRTSGGRPIARWVASAAPAGLVLAVPLAYESGPRVPAMTWHPWGAVVAVVVIAAGLVGRLTIKWLAPTSYRRTAVSAAGRFLSGGAVVMMTGAALVLTVAPVKPHERFPQTVTDPIPAYADALGGSDALYVDVYSVDAELPAFVGRATYRGEQLLTWAPPSEFAVLFGAMGIYHAGFNLLSGTFPRLNSAGAQKIVFRRDAQVLIMSLTGDHFDQAARSLARFDSVVVRRRVLAHGSYHLHVWLVEFPRYLHPPACKPCT